MKLMYGPLSPYARKVRIAAIETGTADRIELEQVDVAPGKKNETYSHTVNPLRKIPALILDDGHTTLVDSTVICEYLDTLAGGGRIVPTSGPERWRVLTEHAVANGMCDAIISVRYETSLRPEALRWPVWIDDQWDKILSGLAWFESHADAALKTTPGPLDLSQIALACCLGYADFRFVEIAWRSRFPLVAKWYQEAISRPSLAKTAPENAPKP
jgi:glutathione S-transferase